MEREIPLNCQRLPHTIRNTIFNIQLWVHPANENLHLLRPRFHQKNYSPSLPRISPLVRPPPSVNVIMPARPAPLQTSGPAFHHQMRSPVPFSPLPSSLPRTPIAGFDPLRARDEIIKTPITPPTAYTDFLKNTINSPALLSPRSSLPYSPVTASMSSTTCRRGYLTPATPYPPTLNVTSAGNNKKPRARSPQSPVSVTSSGSSQSEASDDEGSATEHEDEEESPRSTRAASPGPAVVVTDERQTRKTVVKTTYVATVDLSPAPKGKRRRID